MAEGGSVRGEDTWRQSLFNLQSSHQDRQRNREKRNQGRRERARCWQKRAVGQANQRQIPSIITSLIRIRTHQRAYMRIPKHQWRLYSRWVFEGLIRLKKTPQKEGYSEVLVKVVFPTFGFSQCVPVLFLKSFGAAWATKQPAWSINLKLWRSFRQHPPEKH